MATDTTHDPEALIRTVRERAEWVQANPETFPENLVQVHADELVTICALAARGTLPCQCCTPTCVEDGCRCKSDEQREADNAPLSGTRGEAFAHVPLTDAEKLPDPDYGI